MKALRTYLCLLACTAAQEILSTATSSKRKDNLKIYEDYWKTFFYKAQEFINSKTPKMALLAEIRNDADNFDTRTMNMREFSNPTVKSETAMIKSFPRSLLQDADGLTETLVNDTVIWKNTRTAHNNRRALNARLHDASQTLQASFQRWRSKNAMEKQKQRESLKEENANLRIYKDYWKTFSDKAQRFMDSDPPDMALFGEIRSDADNFGTLTMNMREFSDPTVRSETARIKSFPKSLLQAVNEADLTETLANNTVIWKKTKIAADNRKTLNDRLKQEISKRSAASI